MDVMANVESRGEVVANLVVITETRLSALYLLGGGWQHTEAIVSRMPQAGHVLQTSTGEVFWDVILPGRESSEPGA
jgi:hypothetical protein